MQITLALRSPSLLLSFVNLLAYILPILLYVTVVFTQDFIRIILKLSIISIISQFFLAIYVAIRNLCNHIKCNFCVFYVN